MERTLTGLFFCSDPHRGASYIRAHSCASRLRGTRLCASQHGSEQFEHYRGDGAFPRFRKRWRNEGVVGAQRGGAL